MISLKRVINVRPDERIRTLVLFLQYFFVVAVTIAGKSARDTYFLSRYDRSFLPLMFAACAIAVASAAALYSHFGRRLSPRALFNGLNILALAGLLAVKSHLDGFSIPALYVWVEIIIAVLTLSFWLTASEIFNPRQAKRLYGLIGGGGAVAAIAVGVTIKPLVKAYGSESLLWLVAIGIAAQWALGSYSSRYAVVSHPVQTHATGRPAKWRFDRYLGSIALVVALSAMTSQIVDYQFKMFAAQTISNEVGLASFFGNFYAVTGAVNLLIQLFLTSTVLSRFGLLTAMLTLPVFLNVGAVAVLIYPSLASAAIGKLSDQTLKFTVNNSAWELLWLPVPSFRRKSMRPVVSGTVKYIAESSVGLCIFFLVSQLGVRYLSLLTIIALGAWMLTAFRMRSLYVNALASALEKGHVSSDDLVLNVQDPAFVGVIEKVFAGGDEAQQVSALELIEGLPLAPWTSVLRRAFKGGSPVIQERILQLATAEPDVLDDDCVMRALLVDGSVALAAIQAVAARKLVKAYPALRSLVRVGTPEVQAAAAAVLLDGQSEEREFAESALSRLLEDANPRCRIAALRSLRNNTNLVPAPLLHIYLRDPSPAVREAALEVVAERRDDTAIGEVLACLADPRTAAAAHEALKSVPVQTAMPHLERHLAASEPPRRKIEILRALASFPAERSVPLLLDYITPEDLNASAEAVRSLLVLVRDRKPPAPALDRVPELLSAMLRNAYHCNRMLKLLASGNSETLLQADLADRIRQIIPIVLGLEMVSSCHRSLADAATIAGEGDPGRIPLLLELLDNVLAQEKRVSITPLIEPLPVEERDLAGAQLYSDLPAKPEPELQKAVYSRREWECAITVDYLWRAGSGLLASVNWERVQDSALTREVRAVVENQVPEMYSTLEKTILLKSVSLFSNIPVEKLAKIAQIAQETRLPAGEAVMRAGEFGDSLFIVADGTVRVHKAGQNLALLAKGDCVGEMALLDHSPRSADVTVEEDAALLRIGREDFNEVMAANPEIMQAIVRLLVRRLREANDKLARRSERVAVGSDALEGR